MIHDVVFDDIEIKSVQNRLQNYFCFFFFFIHSVLSPIERKINNKKQSDNTYTDIFI